MATEKPWNIDEEEGDWIKEAHKKRIAEKKKPHTEKPHTEKPHTVKPQAKVQAQ